MTTIRPAEPGDAAAIQDVLASSARAAYADVLAEEHLRTAFLDLDVDALAGWLEETADDDRVVYLVAEADDGVVGFAQLLAGERAPDHAEDAFLKSLYVLPERWGEGIGSALLSEGVASLPDAADRLELSVLAANDAGKRFYESRGFERTGDGVFGIGEADYATDIYATSI